MLRLSIRLVRSLSSAPRGQNRTANDGGRKPQKLRLSYKHTGTLGGRYAKR